MDVQELFLKNLERWTLFCPQAACLLPAFAALQEGPSKTVTAQEIETWQQPLDLPALKLIYVYGLTTPSVFEALQEWLANEQNFLVILEEDLETIAHYLKSPESSDLLNKKNVWLYYLDPMRKALDELAKLFPGLSYKVTTLFSDESKLLQLKELQAQIDFFHNLHTGQVSEYSQFGAQFYRNYYHNLFSCVNNYIGDALFNRFENVPAIICGAGPSLAKNTPLLKELQERALIFAGGSAMNALNAAGLKPHFGLGIDPNEEHLTRIIMNTGFETPFFFRGRMHYRALNLVHGDKLYITGTSGYSIADYFEKECGLQGESVEEGCNVINFSLAIAAAMGCNPIILVGVDLAYTDHQAYSPGMLNHPIHKPFRSKTENEELIYRIDLHGKPVATLWKWVTESLWFSSFAERNPHIRIINATEGGIGFASIPNMPLADAANQFLGEQHALSCRISGEIQKSLAPAELTYEKLFNLFEQFNQSLTRAQAHLQAHYQDLLNKLKEAEASACHPGGAWSTPLEFKAHLRQNLQAALEVESCYSSFLIDFDRAFELLKMRDYKRLEIDRKLIPDNEWICAVLGLEIERVLFLQKSCAVNECLINQVLSEKKTRYSLQTSDSRPQSESATSPPLAGASSQSRYSLDNHRLIMIDPELGLQIDEEVPPELINAPVRLFDQEGKLKFESYHLQGRLHGPARFYHPDGKLLAESWYYHGLKEGQALCYYASGALYSITRYKHGLQQGKQEYYYENALPRTVISHYQEGQLHGDVFLFHSNGILARKLHFTHGKHDGAEYLWNESGQLLIEAHFKENRPAGIARAWHHNGQIAQESVYNDQFELTSISYWDESGSPITQGFSTSDYFQDVAATSKQLTENLATLFKELTTLAPILTELQGIPLAGEENAAQLELKALAEKLTEIGTAIAQLQQISLQLTQEASSDVNLHGEAFWKTGTLQKEIEQKLSQATLHMQSELTALRGSLSRAIETIIQNAASKSPQEPT